MKQNKLFLALHFLADEVLLMGISEVCQHGNRRLNDITQRQHLTRLTDACFENTHLGVLIQQPNT